MWEWEIDAARDIEMSPDWGSQVDFLEKMPLLAQFTTATPDTAV